MDAPENPAPADPAAPPPEDTFRPSTTEGDLALRKVLRGAKPPPLDIGGIFEGAEVVLAGPTNLCDVQFLANSILVILRPKLPQEPGAQDWSKHAFVFQVSRVSAVGIRDKLSLGIDLLGDPKRRQKFEAGLAAQGAKEEAPDEGKVFDQIDPAEGYVPIEQEIARQKALAAARDRDLAAASAPAPAKQAADKARDVGAKLPGHPHGSGDQGGGQEGGLLDDLFHIGKKAVARWLPSLGSRR